MLATTVICFNTWEINQKYESFFERTYVLVWFVYPAEIEEAATLCCQGHHVLCWLSANHWATVENTTYRLALEILKLKAQVTNGSVIKLTSIVVNGLSIRNKNKIICIKIGYGFVLLCCWFPEASVPTF